MNYLKKLSVIQDITEQEVEYIKVSLASYLNQYQDFLPSLEGDEKAYIMHKVRDIEKILNDFDNPQ